MTIDKLIINLDAHWQLLLIVLLLASLLTTVYFLKQRLTSKQRSQFSKLVVINCFATLAIIGLITKPAWLTEPQDSAVLLTNGFKPTYRGF